MKIQVEYAVIGGFLCGVALGWLTGLVCWWIVLVW